MNLPSIFKKLIKEIQNDFLPDEKIAIPLFTPLLKEIASSSTWLEEKHFRVPDPLSGFCDHLLYEGDDHKMALILTTWLP